MSSVTLNWHDILANGPAGLARALEELQKIAASQAAELTRLHAEVAQLKAQVAAHDTSIRRLYDDRI